MGGPIMSKRFGLPGATEQRPWAAAGGSAISPIFLIGGTPIAVLGGVFGGGFPLGGPVSQLYRTGGPAPNTLYASTLTSAGPIGAFLLGLSGAPLTGIGMANQPLVPSSVGEIGLPAFPIAGYGTGGLPILVQMAGAGGTDRAGASLGGFT